MRTKPRLPISALSFFRLTRETDAAEALLQAAIVADPSNVVAKLNLAADLIQEGRNDDALGLLPTEFEAVHWPYLGWVDARTLLKIEDEVLGWRWHPFRECLCFGLQN